MFRQLAVSLIGVDMGHTTSKVAVRFANILRNLIPSSDVGVMEMTASAMGKLALASSTTTADYVEYEAKRAFEWLSGDRHEGRRHAAVSSLYLPRSHMHTWCGIRKSIRHVKKLSDMVLVWLSVWNEVQMICKWSS